MAIGIIKIAMSLLSRVSHERSLTVEIGVGDHRFFGEALVDSGNFLCDPMDGSAVVLIKRSAASRLFPEAFLEERADLLDEEYRKKLRLIPVRLVGGRRILFGIRPDAFLIRRKKGSEGVRVVVAYDKEEGSYEGFSVLIPSVVADRG